MPAGSGETDCVPNYISFYGVSVFSRHEKSLIP